MIRPLISVITALIVRDVADLSLISLTRNNHGVIGSV
jgi:hypothetical protein